MALSHIPLVKVLVCSLQVRKEAQEIVFHILQGQMAVLVKVASRSLERMDFFHIRQAHLGRHIGQDDPLEDIR